MLRFLHLTKGALGYVAQQGYTPCVTEADLAKVADVARGKSKSASVASHTSFSTVRQRRPRLRPLTRLGRRRGLRGGGAGASSSSSSSASSSDDESAASDRERTESDDDEPTANRSGRERSDDDDDVDDDDAYSDAASSSRRSGMSGMGRDSDDGRSSNDAADSSDGSDASSSMRHRSRTHSTSTRKNMHWLSRAAFTPFVEVCKDYSKTDTLVSVWASATRQIGCGMPLHEGSLLFVVELGDAAGAKHAKVVVSSDLLLFPDQIEEDQPVVQLVLPRGVVCERIPGKDDDNYYALECVNACCASPILVTCVCAESQQVCRCTRKRSQRTRVSAACQGRN